MNAGTAGLAILALVVGILLFVKQVLNWVCRQGMKAIDERFGDEPLHLYALTANFFGITSRGVGQIRGNGALALSDDVLWFCKALPKQEVEIPLQNVTHVGTRNGHLGKTQFTPLLYVEFNTPDGPDSVAWRVPDCDIWVERLSELTVGAPISENSKAMSTL